MSYRVLQKDRSSGLTGPKITKLIKKIIEYVPGKGHLSGESDEGDYTDENNPELLKWQGQEDDKSANFLKSVDSRTDLSDEKYADGFEYYSDPYQKFVLRLGLNRKATQVTSSQFDQIAQQTGATVFYRGVSGVDAVKRMLDADNSHTGGGTYGGGYYFTATRSDAEDYGSWASMKKYGTSKNARVMRMMLSPTARVVDYNTLRSRMSSEYNSKLQSSLRIAGQGGTYGGTSNGYSGNSGESQAALKMGYNVIRVGTGPSAYYVGLTRDAFIIDKKSYKA